MKYADHGGNLVDGKPLSFRQHSDLVIHPCVKLVKTRVSHESPPGQIERNLAVAYVPNLDRLDLRRARYITKQAIVGCADQHKHEHCAFACTYLQ